VEAQYVFYTFAAFDAVLYLLDASAPDCAGLEIAMACNDDYFPGSVMPFVAVRLAAGQRVVVVVDGAASEEDGPFSIRAEVRR